MSYCALTTYRKITVCSSRMGNLIAIIIYLLNLKEFFQEKASKNLAKLLKLLAGKYFE